MLTCMYKYENIPACYYVSVCVYACVYAYLKISNKDFKIKKVRMYRDMAGPNLIVILIAVGTDR